MVASLCRRSGMLIVLGLAAGTANADVSISKHVPPPNSRGTSLGGSAAVSGEQAVVGAPNAAGAVPNSGAAYVFAKAGDNWSQIAMLTAPDGAGGDLFGRSVALSGDWLAVGAPEDDAPSNSGSVHLFRNAGGNWQYHSKLTAPDAATNDLFGTSVALEGGWLLVGAPNDDTGAFNAGAVYAFAYDESNGAWVFSGQITPGLAGDFFGISLALRGGIAAIGATGDDGRALNAGAAYAYRLEDDAWVQEGVLRGSDSGASDEFGASVAVGQDWIVVGAPRDNEGLHVDAGAAFFFHFDGATWSEAFKYISADASASDFLGRSVTIDGDVAAVGSPAEDSTGTNAGAVYVLRRVDGLWVADPQLTAPDTAAFDAFGTAVALAGDELFVGATGDDDSGDGAGAVYAATFSPPNLPPQCSAGVLYEAECAGAATRVELDGSGSIDPDGDGLQYEWSSDCPEASFDDPSSPRPVLTLQGGCARECNVTLTVSDGVNPPVSCQAGVRVADTTAPELAVPADVEIFDGEDDAPEALGSAVATDCDPAVQITFADEVDPSECVADVVLSKTRRTWTATDACGNSISGTQIIRRSRRVLLMDVMPNACPNSFALGSGGPVTVTLLGEGDADLAGVEIASLRISRADCTGSALAPSPAVKVGDRGSPMSSEACACQSSKRDKIDDLQLSFDGKALAATLGLTGMEGSVTVAVTGILYTEECPEGAAFIALDCLNVTRSAPGGRGGSPPSPPPPSPAPVVDPCASGMVPGLMLTGGLLLTAKGRRRWRRAAE